jgi:hypothetical protein
MQMRLHRDGETNATYESCIENVRAKDYYNFIDFAHGWEQSMAEPIRLPRYESGGAASYIAEMSRDLAALARRNGLDTLGYLLDIARLEAESAEKSARPPDDVA